MEGKGRKKQNKPTGDRTSVKVSTKNEKGRSQKSSEGLSLNETLKPDLGSVRRRRYASLGENTQSKSFAERRP